jgi:hypothetical protein
MYPENGTQLFTSGYRWFPKQNHARAWYKRGSHILLSGASIRWGSRMLGGRYTRTFWSCSTSSFAWEMDTSAVAVRVYHALQRRMQERAA